MSTWPRDSLISYGTLLAALSMSTAVFIYGLLNHSSPMLSLGLFSLFIFLLISTLFRFTYPAILGFIVLVISVAFIVGTSGILEFKVLVSLTGLSVISFLLLRLIELPLGGVSQTHQNGLNADNQTEQFNSLADNVPILIWTAKADGTIDFISNQIITFCGLSIEKILGDWLAVLHPDDREDAIKLWQASIENKEIYQTEYRIKRADGAYVWHSIEGRPVINEEGIVTKWYGSSTNVENFKVLHRKSEDLAQKLNITINSITEAFLTVDEQFKITFVNSRAALIFAKDPDQLLNSVIWSHDILSEDDAFAIRFKEALHYKRILQFEEFLVAKQVWLDVNVYPSRLGLTICFNNISQKREEQQELKLLRTAVSRLNDIILITEAEPFDHPGPRVVFVNEAFERRTGYSKEDIIGKTPRILQGKNTQRDSLNKIRTALTKWQPVRTQLINYTKTGEEFWLELDIVPIADEKGWYTHWVAVERDITIQKQAEQQLLQSQKMESIGQITGGIAHDFNNLLTVILGNAELLVENMADDSPERPLVETLLSAANRGEKLTTSLLTFSSKQTLLPSQLNINTLLVNLSTMLKTTLGAQHELQLELAPELPLVMADEAHLESCILNLVINGRDAMRSPGSITISTQYKNITELANNELEYEHYVSVKVKDTGEGMTEEVKQRIFEPFFSTKSFGKGTGLGLSMVFGFARQTGGDVVVSSEPSNGATFELVLPCSLTEEIEAKSVNQEQVRAKKNWRLLLVEDDEMVRQYVYDVLSKEGFSITQAENALEALSIVQAGQQFDIVFTDIVMPGSINGFELAERLYQLFPDMPVLFTSGYSDNTGKLQQRISQENYLLRKPYRKTELLSRLDQLLSAATKQKATHEA